MRASFVGSICGLYIFLSSYSYAQTVLPEVSVKDSAAYRRSLLSSTSPVFDINANDLDKLGLLNVSDALKMANGVTVRDYGGLGGMKTVSIRNLGAEHTGVMYDGVPVSNCQAGQIDIARFSTDNLSSIRMGIGAPTEMLMPASMEPFSGSLMLTTGRKDSWVKASYGSWNTLSTAANVNYNRLNAFVNYNHTDGGYPFILTNGQEKTKEHRNNGRVDAVNGELNYCYRFKDISSADAKPKQGSGLHDQTLDIKTYYYYSDRALPGGVIYYNNEAHERLWDENTFTQVKYNLGIGSKWDILAIAKFNHSWNKYFDGSQIDDGGIAMHTYKYRQNETFASLGANYRVARTNDKLQLSAVVDQFWNTLSTNIPEFTHKYRTTTYATARARFHNSWITANASVLYTYLNEKINRKKVTPNASVSIKPFASKEFYLRTSWRKAFRLPTFNDMYYYRLGNHNLRPERTNEWDLGFTYADNLYSGNLSITADAFYNNVKDLIIAVPTTFAWKMYNYGNAKIKGGNISADYRWKNIMINAGYNYTDSKIIYTAKHSGNASLIYTNKWANIGYSMQWMGKRYSSSMREKRYKLSRFNDQNITLSRLFNIGKNSLDVALVGKNLFNCQYEIIQFYPMPGRQFSITIKYNIL